MQRNVRTAISSRRVTGLVALLTTMFLLVHLITPQLALLSRTAFALERIVGIAFSASTNLFGLTVICAGAGILVLLDRRRRSKVRQASN